MARPKNSKPTAAGAGAGRGKLLFISYFFPPTAGGGVFRPLAMVKYLSRLGWNVTVITSTTPRHYPTDPDLEKQIPSTVEIIRIPVVWEGSMLRRGLGRLELGWIPKALITPDERVFWAERAATHARKLINQSSFDCLYTTGPPHSILLSGLWLKREFKTVPWVAEFRDPWTLAPYLTQANAHHRRFARDVEADLMEKADAVVMVTPSFARMMKEKYPDFAGKVNCVENGFDTEDFAQLPREKPRNSEFTIVAAGTVFGRYNMNDFLDGVEELRKTSSLIYERISVNFQGLPDSDLERRLLESGLKDRCRSRGFVAHRENIRDLASADLLILPLSKVPNGEGHIPSRAYEFVASGAPILAICPDGDLADLVSRFPNARRLTPGDHKAVAKAIEESVLKWESGDSSKTNIPLPAQYSREARAKEMDRIMVGLLCKNKEGS